MYSCNAADAIFAGDLKPFSSSTRIASRCTARAQQPRLHPTHTHTTSRRATPTSTTAARCHRFDHRRAEEEGGHRGTLAHRGHAYALSLTGGAFALRLGHHKDSSAPHRRAHQQLPAR